MTAIFQPAATTNAQTLTTTQVHQKLQALLQPLPAGIALMADFVARPYLQAGRLAQVLPAWQLVGSYAPRMAYAVYAPGPHIPPKLRALVDYLQEQASASLSPSGGHNLVES